MIPTKDQCQELIDNTNSELITVDGVYGRKFVKKIDDSKYIFLPSGTYWNETIHYNGNDGYYWSSSRYFEYNVFNKAWYLGFSSSKVNMYNNYHYTGRSIRGIRI